MPCCQWRHFTFIYSQSLFRIQSLSSYHGTVTRHIALRQVICRAVPPHPQSVRLPPILSNFRYNDCRCEGHEDENGTSSHQSSDNRQHRRWRRWLFALAAALAVAFAPLFVDIDGNQLLVSILPKVLRSAIALPTS